MTPVILVHATGWALLHGLWQAALLALLVRVALVFATEARLRFAWAWSALVLIGLAFVATWRIELAQARRALALVDALGPASTAAVGTLELAMPWLVLAWLLGATYFLARAAVGLLGVARLRARARSIDAGFEQLCLQLGTRLGIGRPVAIAESPTLDTPAVIGWLRPLILLPLGWAARLQPAVLEAALAHELAHVRRGDYLLNAVIVAVEAACFHHPCVWWLASVARREREHACDDLVVDLVQDRRSYAHALFELEQLRPIAGGSRPAVALGVDGAPLLERIRRLQTASPRPAHSTKARPTMSILSRLPAHAPTFVLLCALGLALVAPACAESGPTVGEGSIEPGDAAANVDVPWLPEAVNRHRSAIEDAARRHGVDPDLLAIVVMVESGGDPQALSPAGARGLMQIMPATAQEIAGSRGISDYQPEQLEQIERNLDFGAWYLARQLERWGEVELAAAAYNGGPAAVEAWQDGRGELSEETERYRSMVSALWQGRHADQRPTL
ncbi:MAG: transglycosylase SLT domain-containing protein [Myxococcales bacterium]|nr:transglycosylase SLT domain-containing protein [Myxococcales bacterium]